MLEALQLPEYTEQCFPAGTGLNIIREYTNSAGKHLDAWIPTQHGIVEVHQTIFSGGSKYCQMEFILRNKRYVRTWHKFWCRPSIAKVAKEFVSEITKRIDL